MNRYTQQSNKLYWVLFFWFLSGVFFTVRAEDIPDRLRKVIEDRFPGAEIKEIESELWEGRPVTEVELTTRDGTDYEVFLSKSGEILHTEEEKGLPWIGGELTIGFGVRGEQEIYRDVDTEFSPAPFLFYENGPFEIGGQGGLGASYRLYGNDFFEVRVQGSVMMGDGYDSEDSAYFKGMDELDTWYGAGLELIFSYAGWQAELAFLQDVSGEHEGQKVEFSVAYPFFVAGFELTPSLSVTWLSEKKRSTIFTGFPPGKPVSIGPPIHPAPASNSRPNSWLKGRFTATCP